MTQTRALKVVQEVAQALEHFGAVWAFHNNATVAADRHIGLRVDGGLRAEGGQASNTLGKV